MGEQKKWSQPTEPNVSVAANFRCIFTYERSDDHSKEAAEISNRGVSWLCSNFLFHGLQNPADSADSKARSARGVNFLTICKTLWHTYLHLLTRIVKGIPFCVRRDGVPGNRDAIITLRFLLRTETLPFICISIRSWMGVSSYVMCKSREIFGHYIGTQLLNLSKTITIILGITGKLPQALSNFREQAVGELSFTTTLLNFIGSLVRFTQCSSNWPVMR